MTYKETLTTYTAAFIDQLSHTIKHAVISPGSRSTPISLLLMKHPDIKVHINVDERSAAFFALGIAKSTQEPVAIVCTSGTAAANYYPAIVEAKLSRVPLIVITADRPHELRDVGAPQTIDQLHLYGDHVKWYCEMALPEMTEISISYVRNVAKQSSMMAVTEPAGPVHLNFPVREPLLPDLAKDYFSIGRSDFCSDIGTRMVSAAHIDTLVHLLADKERGIIVCGEMHDESFPKAIVQLAEKLQYPLLADPLSQLRVQEYEDQVIDCYDTFLRVEKAVDTFRPEVIIRFGPLPVSKALTLYMKKHKNVDVIAVDEGAGWRDPIGHITQMVYSNETIFCEQLSQSIIERTPTSWYAKWKEINTKTKRGLLAIQQVEQLNEGRVFIELKKLLPSNANLFVSNSMPIRDCDTFFHGYEDGIKLLANRGANGIDGVVSTALGTSVDDNRPTVLVIGDLSFFHDMNGLLAAKMEKRNMTIIVINNDGGGIFSFLPQASEREYFEQLFGTPHGLDFSHAVTMYGGEFTRVQSWHEFEQIVKQSVVSVGLNVIEVVTDREENVQIHRKLWKDVSQEINMSISGNQNEN